MIPERGLDLLTGRERECLTAYFTLGHRGFAARSLGISENTLKGHLASARRKLVLSDQQIAALLFPDRVGPHPRRVSPERVMEEQGGSLQFAPQPTGTPTVVEPLTDEVALPQQRRIIGRRNDLSITMRILVILAMMLAITATYVLTFAMLDGVQRVADQVNPIEDHRK